MLTRNEQLFKNNLIAELALNGTDLPFKAIIARADSFKEMIAKLEAIRVKLEEVTKYREVKMIQYGHRFTFAVNTPSKWRKDKAVTLLILNVKGQIDGAMTVPGLNPRAIIPHTAIEKQVQESIKDGFNKLIELGCEPTTIPSIFANAAYLELIDRGLIQVSEKSLISERRVDDTLRDI